VSCSTAVVLMAGVLPVSLSIRALRHPRLTSELLAVLWLPFTDEPTADGCSLRGERALGVAAGGR
jgi:hypothetical protein